METRQNTMVYRISDIKVVDRKEVSVNQSSGHVRTKPHHWSTACFCAFCLEVVFKTCPKIIADTLLSWTPGKCMVSQWKWMFPPIKKSKVDQNPSQKNPANNEKFIFIFLCIYVYLYNKPFPLKPNDCLKLRSLSLQSIPLGCRKARRNIDF